MKKRITELDALRGIAALMVVFFHFTMDHEQAALGFNLGATGVDLFFIISGFVILMTTERCKTWKDFVMSRFSRLYPAYWVAVTFTSLLVVVALLAGYQQKHDINFALRYVGNMTMFQYYMNIPNIDGPYWTLIIELVFYILMLVLMVTKNLVNIEKIGAILLLVVFVFSGLFNLGVNDAIMQKIADAVPLIKYFPLFFSGILIYKMKLGKVTAWRLFLLACSYGLQLSLFAKCYEIRGFMSFNGYALMLTIYYGLFLLFLADKLNFIVNKVTLKLGEISYSLYLIHQFISIKLVIPTALKFGFNFWGAASAALIVSVTLALCINHFVEKPSLIYFRNWYNNYKHKNSDAAQVKLSHV